MGSEMCIRDRHQRDVAQPEADRAPDPVVDLVGPGTELVGMGEIGGMRDGALAADGRARGFHGVLSTRGPPAGGGVTPPCAQAGPGPF